MIKDLIGEILPLRFFLCVVLLFNLHD